LVNDMGPARRYRRKPPPRRWRLLGAAGAALCAVVAVGGVVSGGASSGVEHVVVHRGDTLWGIAAAHFAGDDIQSRVAEIESVNHLDGAGLSPGRILTLPAP